MRLICLLGRDVGWLPVRQGVGSSIRADSGGFLEAQWSRKTLTGLDSRAWLACLVGARPYSVLFVLEDAYLTAFGWAVGCLV